MSRHEAKFIILVTYANKKTEKIGRATRELAQEKAAELAKRDDVIKVKVEPVK